MTLKVMIKLWPTFSFLCVECSPGHYGIDCRKKCSGHCRKDKPCDRIHGECTGGCQDGFVGTHCTNCEKCYF